MDFNYIAAHFIGRIYTGTYDSGNYNVLLDLLQEEDVMSQVYYLLSTRGKLNDIPEDFQQRLLTRRINNLGQNLCIKYETEKIISTFDNWGIRALLLKGTRFSERFFGHFSVRPTSDIDILINKKSSEVVRKVLNAMGYEGPKQGSPGHFHVEYTNKVSKFNYQIQVEVHYDLMPTNRANMDLDNLWDNASQINGYNSVYELSTQDSFYFTCLHAGRHGLTMLKHLIDIIQIIYSSSNEINFNRLYTQAKNDQTLSLVGVVLSTVYDCFPFLEEFKPLPDMFRKFPTKNVLRSQIAFDLAILDTWNSKLEHLLNWLFPSKCQAEIWVQGENFRTIVGAYAALYSQRVKKMIFLIRT